MDKLTAARKHFITITEHRLLVMRYCFRMGLYGQGLTHDLSKYTPAEFMTGVRYYQGNKSPNAAERDEKGYSAAWLHHKGRNRHHYEYWTDVSVKDRIGTVGVKMPLRYVAEMLADRIAACRTYQKDAYTNRSPWNYYKINCDIITIHPETKLLLEKLLKMLAVRGEEETLRYMRWLLFVKKEYPADCLLPASAACRGTQESGMSSAACRGTQESGMSSAACRRQQESDTPAATCRRRQKSDTPAAAQEGGC